MATDHRTKLAGIKTLSQLIAYLRDEMNWPISQDSFEDVDDLFYDFTADELGIDPKTAAKIESIKRLRPLSVNQPWGIFFVKFEPKKLPVVALRRILGQVALKKRPSANSAERAAWAADDLLFISNYGEGSERQITFAHFAKAQGGQNLPTLKVLGWDNRDTALHLDAVAKELTEHLAWPADDREAEAWRTEWRGAFTLGHGEVITTSKQLSIRLAGLARDIRDRIQSALRFETDRGPLTKLMKAFQTSLVHDLDADGFADMYAQTIAYGLLSARIADPLKKTVDDFASHMRTNPFLRELMEMFLKVGGRSGKASGPGIDFDELGVSEVVQLLDGAKMEAVVLDFGDKNPQEDPVIHFYEQFLKEYDAKKRMQRGVFYTPRPVVSYIVRSVDELLRTEFGLEDGLADTTTWGEMAKRHKDLKIPEGTSSDQPFVQILDPATGTGTFLVEVIELIHTTMVAKWKAQGHGDKKIEALWNEYVPKHLLTRLHAFELLMAPYAIAHLKVGLKLYESGYRFGSGERARIYLTNALEPAQDFSGTFEFAIPALAHEVQEVNKIKRKQRFTVVIGNPPYSNYGQLNKTPFILNLLNDYKRDLGERKINLDDDFIKFIRFSQNEIELAGRGVIGLITSNTFVDGVTHRQLRRCLMDSFDRICILNLHGNSRKGELTPEGAKDENVFDIQQGVSISLLSRASDVPADQSVFAMDFWGSRAKKFLRLLEESWLRAEWRLLSPSAPYWFFLVGGDLERSDYRDFWRLLDVLPYFNSGIQTKRDSLTIHFTFEELRKAVADMRTLSDGDLRLRYELPEDGRDWTLRNAREDLAKNEPSEMSLLYRPFDLRKTAYTGKTKGFLAYPRTETTNQMLAANVGLVTRRTAENTARWCQVFVSSSPIDINALSAQTYIHPIFRATAERKQYSLESGKTAGGVRDTYFSVEFLGAMAKAAASPVEFARSGEAEQAWMPEAVLGYVYAVFHSPSYRSRYEEFLKIDFPRVPIPGSAALFEQMASLGSELVELHLMKAKKLNEPISKYFGPRSPEVARVCWAEETVWLGVGATRKERATSAETAGFRGVPEEVWGFQVGGYRVCEKWLKDRRGRRLSKAEIDHYQRIIVALSETIRLMKEIDEVIDQHGGWPGAFQTSESKIAPAEVIPYRPRTVEPKPEDRYVTCVPLLPLKVAAGAFGEGQPAFEDDEAEWIEVGGGRRLRPGMFAAQVAGKSMEPEIPDGAYCLFRAPVEGSRQGKTVLVELRDAADPETGERYTVKRYESEKVADGESWRHAAITLRPANSEFDPIVLEAGDEDRLRVVAEFLEVVEDRPAMAQERGSTLDVVEAPTKAPSLTHVDPSRGISRAAEIAMEMAPLFREPEVPTTVRKIGEVEAPEAMCAIRDLFESSAGRDGIERDEAIRAVARSLGFERTGKNIYEAIDSYLVAAARRGIVETVSGTVHLVARSIAEYDRPLLKDQFLASLGGYSWVEREEAIRTFARWLGYRRTGSVINDAARSLINGLIRDGRLEADGGSVRRVR